MVVVVSVVVFIVSHKKLTLNFGQNLVNLYTDCYFYHNKIHHISMDVNSFRAVYWFICYPMKKGQKNNVMIKFQDDRQWSKTLRSKRRC